MIAAQSFALRRTLITTFSSTDMARPKLHFPDAPVGRRSADAASTHSGYRIYPTYRRTASGEYTGDLKVVRVADAKLIYPFDGAAVIGPFPVAQAARDAAAQLGATLVDADLQNPEP